MEISISSFKTETSAGSIGETVKLTLDRSLDTVRPRPAANIPRKTDSNLWSINAPKLRAILIVWA
jgi:hypothetical protein